MSPTSSKAVRRQSFPLAKAARMSLAADSGTPVAAGTTEIAVTVTVTFRVVAG